MGKRAIVLVLFVASFGCLLHGADCSSRRMLWAHNTPWFRPEDNSHFTSWFYNYPLQDSSNDANAMAICLREEVKRAQKAGIDGYMIDLGGDSQRRHSHHSFMVPIYLRACEGTDFQISICLDGKVDVSYWVGEFKRILGQWGNHPNYGKVGEKFIVSTYTYFAFSAEEWRELKRQMAEAGLPIYVVANVAPLPHASLDIKRLEQYLEGFDCLYMFDSPGHANEKVDHNNRVLADFAKVHGKEFMPCLHPGYYGAWMGMFNDFYNPFHCLDFFYSTFEAALPLKPKWVHLTTWNDNVETATHERAFTFGVTRSLEFYSRYLKGEEILAPEPDVLFAYHREEVSGTLLRLEAMSLPCVGREGISVSGVLRDWRGAVVGKLAKRRLKRSGFDRCEWLVRTSELSHTPHLTPEFTLESGDWSHRFVGPSIFLVWSWLQNAVTVNVPSSRMLSPFPHSLEVTQGGDRLDAKVTFSCPVPLRRIVLFRNDRPVGLFQPNLGQDQLLLSTSLGDPDDHFSLTVKNGRILRATKKGNSNNHAYPYFNWTPVKLNSKTRSGGHGITFLGKDDMVVVLTDKNGKTYELDPHELVRKRSISVAGTTWRHTQEMTLANDIPLDCMMSDALSMSMFARPPYKSDHFYVRFETHDNRAFMSEPIYPFASEPLTMSLPILETTTSLDTQSGGSGWCFRNDSEFLTPLKKLPFTENSVVVGEVSTLANRRCLWSFEGTGNDSHGDYGISIPERMFIESGYKGKAIEFDGKSQVRMRFRLWPMGGTGTTSFAINPKPLGDKPQSIIYKEGWCDGISVNLLPNGKLEIFRQVNAKRPESTNTVTDRLAAKTPVLVNRWTKIDIVGTASTLKLYIDGVLDAEIGLTPVRSYGNGHVYLGGCMPGCVMYRGGLDELSIQSLPFEP